MTRVAEGVDYSFDHPNPRGLAEAGKHFAMRYVGPGSASKRLTPAERDELFAAGLDIVLLIEGATRDPMNGRSAGVQHGQLALAQANALGAPKALPMYAAIDWDVTVAEWAVALQYLRGVGDVIGLDQVGVYGGVRAMEWAHRDGFDWLFQTYAWSTIPNSGGKIRWFDGNTIEQYRNGVTMAGGTVDLCRSMKADYGQWTKRPPVVKETEMTPRFLKVTDQNGKLWVSNGPARWPLSSEEVAKKAMAAFGQVYPRDLFEITWGYLEGFGLDLSAAGATAPNVLTDAQVAEVKAAAEAGGATALNGATINLTFNKPA